jgi:hypothetical protein
MHRIIALVVLVATVIGLAHYIEITARPKGRAAIRAQQAGEAHAPGDGHDHGPGDGHAHGPGDGHNH